MPNIEIALKDYKNAPDGSLLVKKGDKWLPTSFEELNAKNNKRLKHLEELDAKFEILAKSNKHFKKDAKSHFMVVFSSFKIGVMTGDIEIDDELLLSLDKAVLNNEISVLDAIKKHPYLEDTFTKLFLSDKDYITFPEV